jgi:hypothetical protein
MAGAMRNVNVDLNFMINVYFTVFNKKVFSYAGQYFFMFVNLPEWIHHHSRSMCAEMYAKYKHTVTQSTHCHTIIARKSETRENKKRQEKAIRNSW